MKESDDLLQEYERRRPKRRQLTARQKRMIRKAWQRRTKMLSKATNDG